MQIDAKLTMPFEGQDARGEIGVDEKMFTVQCNPDTGVAYKLDAAVIGRLKRFT